MKPTSNTQHKIVSRRDRKWSSVYGIEIGRVLVLKRFGLKLAISAMHIT